MPDESDVYLKQAGTGLAWMGPRTTFDPIQYAKDAITVEQQKDAAKQKKFEDLFKNAKVGDVLANDSLGEGEMINTIYSTAIPYFQGGDIGQGEAVAKQLLNEYSGINQAMQIEKTNFTTSFNEANKSADLTGRELTLSNLDIYAYPERYIGTQEFSDLQESWDQAGIMAENSNLVKSNPKHKADLQRMYFREANPDLLNQVKSPKSMVEFWNTNKDSFEGIVTLKNQEGLKVNETVYSSPYDQYVNLTTGEISRTGDPNDPNTVLVRGTINRAGSIYDTTPDMQYSAKANFKNLPQDRKDKYANSQNPYRDYYIDTVTGFGGDFKFSETEIKGGQEYSHRIGNFSTISYWSPNPYDDNYTFKGVKTSSGQQESGNVHYWGATYSGPNGQDLEIKTDFRPRYYYNANDDSHAKKELNQDIKLKGAVPFKATVLKGINYGDFKKELSKESSKMGYSNRYQDFLRRFGGRYSKIEDDAMMEDIMLWDDEVQFLLPYSNMRKYLGFGKFVRGTGVYSQESEIEPGRYIDVEQPDMIVPLDPQLNEKIKGETSIKGKGGHDVSIELDEWYPDYDLKIQIGWPTPPASPQNQQRENNNQQKKRKRYTP